MNRTKAKAWFQTFSTLVEIRSLKNSIEYWEKEQKKAADRQVFCYHSLQAHRRKLYEAKGGQ